jgi:hypothetical protein
LFYYVGSELEDSNLNECLKSSKFPIKLFLYLLPFILYHSNSYSRKVGANR